QHIAFCFTCIGRSLEPEAQAALILKDMLEFENAEAAKVLDLTEPKFRHLLADARTAMREQYANLCALVSKTGACYQCRALRDLAPEGQKGPALPVMPLGFEERLEMVRTASRTEPSDSRLTDYF